VANSFTKEKASRVLQLATLDLQDKKSSFVNGENQESV